MFARNFVFTSESLSLFKGIVSKFYLFVDNNTPVADISAYFKFIVSYRCSRLSHLKMNREKSLRYVAMVDEFVDLRRRVPASFFAQLMSRKRLMLSCLKILTVS